MSDARPGASKKRRTDARKTSRMYAARTAFPAETKYFDTSFAATIPVTADWAATNMACSNYVAADGTIGSYTDSALIPSANGSGYGQVVGNKYLLKAMRVRGAVQATAIAGQTAAPNFPCTRIVLVMDTQPNGAQETGPNVFADMGSALQNVFTFQQMAAGMPGRFVILGSQVVQQPDAISFNDAAGTGVATVAQGQFEFTKQWKRGLKVNIKSNSGTAAIANLTDCNIFLLAHSNAPGYVVTLTGCARAYYVD